MKQYDRPPVNVAGNKIAWKSDIAAEMLRRLDIPYIALNPGASYRGFHDSLVNYLGNEAPQMLLCLHEDHVVAIAHGYAKATDKPLACALHSNVGLMHGLMGIFNAWCDRVPMLIVGATGPVAPEKRRPWIDWIHTAKDQGALLRSYVKWDDEPRSAPGIVEAFLRGYQMTTAAPKAPVYICLDAGLQEEEAPADVNIPDVARFKPPAEPSASPADVAEVARLLLAAKSPVLLMGRGSRAQDAWERRVALAELIGAPVVTSLRERAVFPTEHPLHVGPPSGWLRGAPKEAIAKADLIVALDWIDLGGYLQQLKKDSAAIGAKIVHVSLESVLHNGWNMDYFALPPADISIMAGADAFVGQLLDAVNAETNGKPRWNGERSAPLPTAAGYSAKADELLTPHDIEVALSELRETSNEALTLAHTTIGWASTNFHFRGPLDYLGHDGGAGLAAGPGHTIGAALALKDSGRVTVAVLGDGDFLQGATALWTAAHYSIPALFVVSNNRSNFNDEIHQEAVAKVRGRPVENRWVGQRIDDPAPDLAGMARSQGVEAEGPIKTKTELLAAMKRGVAQVKAGKPYFLDVHVAPGYANIIVARHD
ncbi:MAG: thiamine pyrophosphate-binding protein [Alphaproteobacteria bacterium]